MDTSYLNASAKSIVRSIILNYAIALVDIKCKGHLVGLTYAILDELKNSSIYGVDKYYDEKSCMIRWYKYDIILSFEEREGFVDKSYDGKYAVLNIDKK
jgi:hypothetical protein